MNTLINLIFLQQWTARALIVSYLYLDTRIFRRYSPRTALHIVILDLLDNLEIMILVLLLQFWKIMKFN